VILSKEEIQKLRSAVESCLTDPARPEDCQHMGCPYAAEAEETPLGSMLKCQDAMYADMLFLLDDLESREAKPMIENEHGWNCPSCGMKLIGKTASGYPCDLIDLPEDEPIHFCPKCGQAVKWE